jgi:DNA-binding CsgD family transcriptional regulator
MNENLYLINKSAFLFSTGITPKIKEICNPLQQYLGVNCFGYLKVYRDCKYLAFINGYEDFRKKYIENIRKLDPFLVKTIRQVPLNTPYFMLWPTKYIKLPPVVSLYKENNIWHGFYIIYNQKEYCEIFTFAFNTQAEAKEQFYFQNSNLLVKFTHYFRNKAADILDDRDKSKIALFSEKFDFSYVEDSNKKLFLEEIDTNLVLRGMNGNLVNLTNRESEALKLLVKNKTMKEVAQLLDLSPRTVETYINNLKLKLGVSYKNQLIEIFNLKHCL